MKPSVEHTDFEVRTATDLVKHIENTLGWLPPDDLPRWKARQVEAGKINRMMKKDKRCTIDNLLLATELLRRRRQEIKSPVAVCYFVEEALRATAVAENTPDLIERLEAARAVEDRPEWARRLQRVFGPAAILETLEEWEASRG